MWVFVVGGLVLVGVSTVIFMKIGESISASRIQAIPAAQSATSATKVTD